MPTEAQRRAPGFGPQPEVSAASLRGAIRGEILPITVTTSSKTFLVPADWKGSFVRIHAQTADIYYQISLTATAAVADKDARAQEAGNPIALTPSASGNGAGLIPAGQFLDVPFPSSAVTFALQGSVAGVARCHPSES